MQGKMKDKKKIKGILFDMDGTLFDTERLYRDIWLEMGRERGYIINDEMLDRMRGAAIQIGMEIFSAVNPDFDYMEERKHRYARVAEYVRQNGVPKKPGLDAMLSTLKNRGYRLAIGSSTLRDQVSLYLRSACYEDTFDFVCSGDMLEKGHGKPAPDIFLRCAEALALPPEQCLVAEDSVNGIRAGHDAGCFVSGIPDLSDITPVKELCDVVLTELRELPDWLSE